ncbi:MAG TPA: hypothetical protein EYH57_09030 [Sulfurovum sp.]|nr:hypothetical protein [Sulfurovum sp.]
MKTLLKKLIIVFVLFSLVLTGTLLFLFSPLGNETLKPYVERKMEKELGMSVDFSTFSIASDNANFHMQVNKDLDIEVVINYNLLRQSFKGIYRLTAENFVYDEVKLRQANIIGRFEGTPSDLSIDGNGTALDAPLEYALRVVDHTPQKIKATIKSIEFAELLQLSGQPALARGKVDVNIDMPTIGEEGAKGFGHIVLKKASFNEALVKKLYKFELPKKSYVTAKVDAVLKGKIVELLADVNSNLFKMHVYQASIDLGSKKLLAKYSLDVQEMRILTKNKMQGAFNIKGEAEIADEKVNITGRSNSLGGELSFDLGEKPVVTAKKIAVAKLLHLMKQPALATGELSGTAWLENKAMDAGSYELSVKNGTLNKRSIEKNLGYTLPKNASYAFDSKGKIANKKLEGSAKFTSILADLILSNIKVNLENQYMNTNYAVQLHDITMFMPASKKVKKTKVNAKGTLAMTDHIVLKGSTAGLGEKMDFHYDSRTASVDAVGLYVARLMALAGQPAALRGKVNTKVEMTNLKTWEGKFSINSNTMVTQPKEMKKLIGKALNTTVKVESKGNIKKGKAYFNTTLKTGIATVRLKNTIFDIKQSAYTTDYSIDIPDLTKLYILTRRKLYGKLSLKGKASQHKRLKVTGVTQSLGGNIQYLLKEDILTSKITKVPIENILKMSGHKAFFLGNSSGNSRYDLKRDSGVMHLSIEDFKIAPSKLTQTVKLLLKKDPSRIIFKTTRLDANIKGNIVSYTLNAKGKRALIEISSGRFNKMKNINSANFKFVYEKTTITGKIKGNVDHPSISIDPASLMTDEMKTKILKSKTGQKINDALGGNLGGLLKGLKF